MTIERNTIVRCGNGQYIVKRAMYHDNGHCYLATVRYWNQARKVWVDDCGAGYNATHYKTVTGANRAEKTARKYL